MEVGGSLTSCTGMVMVASMDSCGEPLSEHRIPTGKEKNQQIFKFCSENWILFFKNLKNFKNQQIVWFPVGGGLVGLLQ